MLPPNRGDFERVAVVGAGVAGLTVAHDLARIGYKVTIFEAHSEAGGMLTAGVPVFRLPRDLVRNEINAIVSLGVDLRLNQKLGRDFTISGLRAEGYKAIFLGIGLQKGRKLPIPGPTFQTFTTASISCARSTKAPRCRSGRRILVIGGGNVAYDVARSAIRPVDAELEREDTDAEMERGEKTAYDIARSALRLSGDKEVHVVCLEQREQMPADKREIDEGEEEGIHLHNGRGPSSILERKGKAYALRTTKCTSVFDANGRFSPPVR